MSVPPSPDLDRLASWSEEYLFYGDNVSQYSNCALTAVTTRSMVSRFPYGKGSMSLPTAVSCDVYSFPISVTRGNQPASDVWYNGVDLLRTYNIRLCVYDGFGRLIPLSCVWIYYRCRMGFIAVRHDALVACTSTAGRADGLCMSYWVNNATTDGAVSILSSVPSSSTANAVDADSGLAAQLSSGGNQRVWINGWCVPASTSYSGTDFVEVFVEPDLFASFDVTVEDNLTGYQSTFYTSYREVLHLPVADNPDWLILPSDCLEIVIRDSTTNKGLLFTRYSAKSVRQITHQDWSIDRQQLESLQTAMQSSSLYAEVWVRKPRRSLPLTRDVNFISDLYRCTDDVIIEFLSCRGNPDYTFWQAPTLEASPWLSLIYTGGARNYPELGGNGQNLPVPSNPVNTLDIDFYVSALGFYGTATILSSGMRISDFYHGFFTVLLPKVLRGRNVFVYVFVNGLKLLDSQVTVGITSQVLNITLASGSFTDTDTIRVAVRDASGGGSVAWAVTEDNTTLSVDPVPFSLYDTSTTPPTLYAKGPNSWRQDVMADGTWRLTAYPDAYGKSLLYYPSAIMGKGTVVIDDDLTALKALLYPLHGGLDGSSNIIQAPVVDIFLNGHWLVEGIDFVLDYRDGNYWMVITNRNFLEIGTTNNTIEFYIASETMISDSIGYANNGVLPPGNPYLYEATISETFEEGLLVTDVVDKGVYLQRSAAVDGDVCETVLRYSDYVLAYMSTTQQDQDNAKRALITKYFLSLIPATVKISQTSQHQVYSPWLQYVVQLVTTGQFTPVNDPDDSRFVAQFPDEYQLKAIDPTLVDNNAINRQYVSVAACYTMDMADSSSDIRAMVQRLIKLTLNRADSTLGVTPV